MLMLTWPYARSTLAEASASLPTIFHLLVWGCYSFIFLIPSLVITGACQKLAPRARKTIAGLAVTSTVLSLLFIYIDRTIYDLFNFHFNGFVLNLLLTPGGVDSLGSGTETYLSIAEIILRVTLIQISVYVISSRIRPVLNLRWERWAATLFILAMAAQSIVFGLSDIRNDGAILEAAKSYPFYARVTFRGMAAAFGYKSDRKESVNLVVDSSRLNYPLQPIKYSSVKRPPNIVLLVAESLRWDRLTPEIMPNTWALAQQAQRFTQHYSSGNGTREGLFGMFYGLYGSYWTSFLHAQRGPLLMDRVQQLNYQLDLRTSARFSYPEFNKTLFANVPLEVQHEANDKLNAWQNDAANTDAVIDFLAKHDPQRPFMSFFFFESTHARYSFPSSAVIAKPYLEKIDYGDMSKASLSPHIDEMINRYTNSAHWVDAQMGRIYDYLKENNLLENTIVIVTGDHGEEFLEKGFWGHNSSFVDEQTHNPMVVSMPGQTHAEFNHLTSHMDIATTLLLQLGAPSDNASYALGRNLFDTSARPYLVISDWHSICVRTADMKYRIPYTNRGTDHWQPTTPNDGTYSNAEATTTLNKNRDVIVQAIQNSSLFSRQASSEKNRIAIIPPSP
jgi:uncharacterized protein